MTTTTIAMKVIAMMIARRIGTPITTRTNTTEIKEISINNAVTAEERKEIVMTAKTATTTTTTIGINNDTCLLNVRIVLVLQSPHIMLVKYQIIPEETRGHIKMVGVMREIMETKVEILTIEISLPKITKKKTNHVWCCVSLKK